MLNSGIVWFRLKINGMLDLVNCVVWCSMFLWLLGLIRLSWVGSVFLIELMFEWFIVFGWNVVIWLLLWLVVIIVCVVNVFGIFVMCVVEILSFFR